MKKIKSILITFSIIAAIALMFIALYKFIVSIGVNSWWLNKIGAITGVKSTLGQWIISLTLDIIIGAIIFVVVVWTRGDSNNE